jgi:AcrR family transcriptional regulator
MAPKIVDKEARKRTILVAAAEMFARYGYQRATIDQIAEAAGVAKGSVYLSFASKEDLFHALFEALFQDALLDESAGSDDEPPLVRLEQTLYRVTDAVDANDTLIPLTLEFWSVCGVAETRERFGRSYAELFTGFRAQLIERLDEAAARGEIEPNLPHAALASCLIAMIDGLLIQQWTVPGLKASDMLRQALPAWLGALKRHAGRSG